MSTLHKQKWLGIGLILFVSIGSIRAVQESRVAQRESEERLYLFTLSAEAPFSVVVAPPKPTSTVEVYLNLTGGDVSSPFELFVTVNSEVHYYLLHFRPHTTFVTEQIEYKVPLRVESLELRVSEGQWDGWVYLHGGD